MPMIMKNASNYRWVVFGAIAVGTFVSALDQTSVNVALPSINSHFNATLPAVQWVALGYILTTSVLLLPMGRLADIIGRKRVYTFGFTIFTLSAVLAATSTALIGVILFKVLQGVGAAMVQAVGMAIITSTFPESERGRVIGMFLTVVGIGAITGPIVGGAIIDLLGWRFSFLLGFPFGIISIITGLIFLQEDRDTLERRQSSGRFDWPGAILSSASLGLFLLVITNAHRIGWRSPVVAAGFIGVVVLSTAFVWWQRKASEPMLALELFSHRLFSLSSGAAFFGFLAGTSVFFLMPFYLQDVLGYTAGQAGLMIAPTALFFALSGPVSGGLSDKFGRRRFAVGGLVLSLMAMLVLSRFTENAPLPLVVGMLILLGVGAGTFFSPNASLVLSTVEYSRYGIATAFMNMTRNSANVVGIALATMIVTSVMGSLGYEPSLESVISNNSEGIRAAFTRGLQICYMVMSGFLVIGIVLSSLKGR